MSARTDAARRRHIRLLPSTPPPATYVTVIHEHGHPTALLAAARHGSVVVRTRLMAMAPRYEAARSEAQALYPDRLVVIPRLGEGIPS